MIQPTSNLLGFNRTDALAYAPAKTGTASNSPALSTDRLSSSGADALRTALENTPEIRPDVVERGKRIAVDLNYPTREIIMRLAKMISETSDLTEQS